eukprot:240228-Rhodomonas_salina.3
MAVGCRTRSSTLVHTSRALSCGMLRDSEGNGGAQRVKEQEEALRKHLAKVSSYLQSYERLPRTPWPPT